jgi:hypothetical protein
MSRNFTSRTSSNIQNIFQQIYHFLQAVHLQALFSCASKHLTAITHKLAPANNTALNTTTLRKSADEVTCGNRLELEEPDADFEMRRTPPIGPPSMVPRPRMKYIKLFTLA